MKKDKKNSSYKRLSESQKQINQEIEQKQISQSEESPREHLQKLANGFTNLTKIVVPLATVIGFMSLWGTLIDRNGLDLLPDLISNVSIALGIVLAQFTIIFLVFGLTLFLPAILIRKIVVPSIKKPSCMMGVVFVLSSIMPWIAILGVLWSGEVEDIYSYFLGACTIFSLTLWIFIKKSNYTNTSSMVENILKYALLFVLAHILPLNVISYLDSFLNQNSGLIYVGILIFIIGCNNFFVYYATLRKENVFIMPTFFLIIVCLLAFVFIPGFYAKTYFFLGIMQSEKQVKKYMFHPEYIEKSPLKQYIKPSKDGSYIVNGYLAWNLGDTVIFCPYGEQLADVKLPNCRKANKFKQEVSSNPSKIDFNTGLRIERKILVALPQEADNR